MRLAEPPAPAPPLARHPGACARCGAALEPDQEWCLECGSARTVVQSPPDPRFAFALVAVVALAVLATLLIAVHQAGRGGGTTTIATVTSAATAPRPHAAHPTLASWPVGLSGWTVVLGRRRQRAIAIAQARRLAAVGLATGVLDSSQHPHLKPGFYLVFSGRYPSGAAALAAAAALRARGDPEAIAREVARPGGL